jgi:hypothetical protein
MLLTQRQPVAERFKRREASRTIYRRTIQHINGRVTVLLRDCDCDLPRVQLHTGWLFVTLKAAHCRHLASNRRDQGAGRARPEQQEPVAVSLAI